MEYWRVVTNCHNRHLSVSENLTKPIKHSQTGSGNEWMGREEGKASVKMNGFSWRPAGRQQLFSNGRLNFRFSLFMFQYLVHCVRLFKSKTCVLDFTSVLSPSQFYQNSFLDASVSNLFFWHWNSLVYLVLLNILLTAASRAHLCVQSDIRVRRNSWVWSIKEQGMSRVLWMLTGSEGVRKWPPPLFSITLIVSNVAIFISQLATFMEEREPVSWLLPWPECSILIYNTFLRHQVSFWKALKSKSNRILLLS